MNQHHHFAALLFSFMFLLPAVVALYFAWAVWLDRKHLALKEWRRQFFKYGLFSATGASLLIYPGCLRILEVDGPPTGFWLVTNWAVAVLWALSVVAALTGKGSPRVLLISWSILFFLGLFGLDLSMTP